MPCTDITDKLTITIDNDDRILDYSLEKLTCGGQVGPDRMISKWLIGKTVSEVLHTELDQFHALLKTKTDLKEYLALKHFMAVQAGFAVYSGCEAGSISDHCTLDSIENTDEKTVVVFHQDVAGVVEQIKSCGGCCKG